MKILVISSYELGHQPFHAATATAALRAAGHEVRPIDLSLASLTRTDIGWTDRVAFAVPMHTAMRIALDEAKSIGVIRPGLPICFFGLYATAGDLPLGAAAIAGEYESELVRWAADPGTGVRVDLGRSALQFAPDRNDLPSLSAYVSLELAGEKFIAGSTSATRGCRYLCKHCPVPTVYDGTFRVVDRDLVVADIDAQVAAGARHITFSDPDFLNGPAHSMRILEEAKQRHPDLTFDATIKVEHVLRYRHLLPRMAELGVVFVVSAFETTNDEILQLLDKGHTAEDMAEAVHLLRANAIEVRPTWLPFTPWTVMGDLVDMLRFLERHDLDVDPIQLTIRLLIPRGSLLLDLPGSVLRPGRFDSDKLSYTWQSADPAVDELQVRLARLVEEMAAGPPDAVLGVLVAEILASAGIDEGAIRLTSGEGRPRLTEPWFC